MIKLKTQYENQDDIPEAFRDLYEEQGGKWNLVGIEGLKTQKDVDAVKGALDKERQLRRDAESKFKKFDRLGDRDIEQMLKDLDDVEDLRSQLEELQEGGGKGEEAITKRINAAVERREKQLQREIERRDKAIAEKHAELEAALQQKGELDGRIKRSTIEGEIARAASTLKVKTEALPDVLMYAHIFEVDDDGKSVRARDGFGATPGIDPASWLSDMKASRPHWWPESQGGGARGGSSGVGSGNPFDKRAPNITDAMRMAKQDPGKALALAKSAGWSSVQDAAVGIAKINAGGGKA
jgi:hypothetical protein